MYELIHEMLANAAILASFIFIAGYMNRDTSLSIYSSIRTKVIIGLFTGLLGIVLMQYNIQISV